MWIKLHKKIFDWEWYTQPHMAHLFIHLLLKANYEASSYRGESVKRGQIVTGRKQLSAETGISEQTIRTCLKRLESTGELTLEANQQSTKITISNYESYQERPRTTNQPINQPINHITEDKKTEEQNNTSSKVPFSDFWNAYGKKVGKAKTEKKWNRLPMSTQKAIMAHIRSYVQSTPDVQYRKNPETYLNSRLWEDEPIASHATTGTPDHSVFVDGAWHKILNRHPDGRFLIEGIGYMPEDVVRQAMRGVN